MPPLSTFSKYLLIAFLASTYKTLPFAYLIRFYSTVIKNIVIPKIRYHRNGKFNTFGYSVKKPTNNSDDDKLAIFEPQTFKTYVSPMEVDMYLHKSNSTYFLDLDIARTDLLTKVFQKIFYRYMDNESGLFKRKSLLNVPYIPVGSVETHFKHELKPFQSFEIHSKVIAWDKKWIFILSKFVSPKNTGDKIYGITLTKYVFKRGRITIEPEAMIREVGLWSDEIDVICKRNLSMVEHMTSLEQLELEASKY
ncbi:probable thioesterase [[Candida] railenensis]|uniref:Probable thioesterase n=1 Tax=[Candida] railenensis TaxID=45579 RepID=A0A9P0QNY3_9ASCO|nr:probable thioesterase [[Candida] railenensis]